MRLHYVYEIHTSIGEICISECIEVQSDSVSIMRDIHIVEAIDGSDNGTIWELEYTNYAFKYKELGHRDDFPEYYL